MAPLDSDKEAMPGQTRRMLAKLACLAALVYSAYILSIGFDHTLLNQHAFRQSQTALTIRALLEGGPWFAYLTPVLGPPWSIPFELPLYQWLVALGVLVTGADLVVVARGTSILFFYASVYVLERLMRAWEIPVLGRRAIVLLMLVSPLYLFWSRAILIESCALFLGLVYVYFATLLLKNKNHSWQHLMGLAVFGVLAATVKLTTFFAFCLVYWGLLCRSFPETGVSVTAIRRWIPALLLGLLLPIAAAYFWVHFCDVQKSLGPLGSELTSANLRGWNFGTLEQKLSLQDWKKFLFRSGDDTLGSWIIIPAVGIAVARASRQARYVYAAGLFLFLVVVGIFTNLHFKHNYYPYANGGFLIFAIGYVIGELLSRKEISRCVLGAALLATMVYACVRHYDKSFLYGSSGDIQPGELIEAIQHRTDKNEVLLVYGMDWSAELAFYSGRRTIIDRNNLEISSEAMQWMLANLGDFRLGAVLDCDGAKQKISDQQLKTRLMELGFDTRPVVTGRMNTAIKSPACSVYLPADRFAGIGKS